MKTLIVIFAILGVTISAVYGQGYGGGASGGYGGGGLGGGGLGGSYGGGNYGGGGVGGGYGGYGGRGYGGRPQYGGGGYGGVKPIMSYGGAVGQGGYAGIGGGGGGYQGAAGGYNQNYGSGGGGSGYGSMSSVYRPKHDYYTSTSDYDLDGIYNRVMGWSSKLMSYVPSLKLRFLEPPSYQMMRRNRIYLNEPQYPGHSPNANVHYEPNIVADSDPGQN